MIKAPNRGAVEQTALEEGPTTLVAVLCCDWANETESGKHNLVGIFDRLIVPSVPRRSPPFFVYVRTAGKAPDELVFTITNPDGVDVARLESRADQPLTDPSEPTLIQLMGRGRIQVDKPGIYWMNVRADGRCIGRAPLIVEVIAQANDTDD